MYLVGYNRPGYLPNVEPIECETFEEAQQALSDELEYMFLQHVLWCEHVGCPREQEILAARSDVAAGRDLVLVGHAYYYIIEAWELSCSFTGMRMTLTKKAT